MIKDFYSSDTLRVLAPLAGGMKSLHSLLRECGFEFTYTSLSKYVQGGAKFDPVLFDKLIEALRKKETFLAREMLRNIEDVYIVLGELLKRQVFVPKGIGEVGDLDVTQQTNVPLTNEEIKEMEAEFGVVLSSEQKDVLKGRRKSLPKSSVSLDDLFDEGESEPEPVKPEQEGFISEFLNDGKGGETPPQNGLTDPFEAELRRTPDVFTSEDHRF